MQKAITNMTEASGGSVPTLDELKAVIQKAEQGDTTVLPVLRTYMALTPGLWEERGNMARLAQRAMIQQVARQNLLVQESLTRKCAALIQELAGPIPSPIEQLLVERIVLCWLQLSVAEALYVHSQEEIVQHD